MWQTTVEWQRALKPVLDSHEISHARFVILALLLWCEEHGIKTNQSTLIEHSRLDKMTVSKSMKILSSQNLVTRGVDEKDTRAKTVILTDEGRNLIRSIVPHIEKADENYFSVLNEKEYVQLVRLLQKLNIKKNYE